MEVEQTARCNMWYLFHSVSINTKETEGQIEVAQAVT